MLKKCVPAFIFAWYTNLASNIWIQEQEERHQELYQKKKTRLPCLLLFNGNYGAWEPWTRGPWDHGAPIGETSTFALCTIIHHSTSTAHPLHTTAPVHCISLRSTVPHYTALHSTAPYTTTHCTLCTARHHPSESPLPPLTPPLGFLPTLTPSIPPLLYFDTSLHYPEIYLPMPPKL